MSPRFPAPDYLIFRVGIAFPATVPPSACIPPPAPWSDLMVARVYACVVGQGGGTDAQTAETE